MATYIFDKPQIEVEKFETDDRRIPHKTLWSKIESETKTDQKVLLAVVNQTVETYYGTAYHLSGNKVVFFLDVNVDAVGTLDVNIQVYNPQTTTWVDLTDFTFAQVTDTNTHTIKEGVLYGTMFRVKYIIGGAGQYDIKVYAIAKW